MTMTLEELRESVAHVCVELDADARYPGLLAAVDSAIRERDELRHAAKVGIDAAWIAEGYHKAYDAMRARAEKAEAELAVIRNAIESAPLGYAETMDEDDEVWAVHWHDERDLLGKRVRLLVESDDERN